MIHVFGKSVEMEPWSLLPGIRVNRLGETGKDIDASSRGGDMPELFDPSIIEVIGIERGIPKWGAELTEETLPPEAGIDRTHIDYNRGCYPGQEVISRLKSIGRVNRLLHGFAAPGSESLVSGMKILSAEGREIGSLTSASQLPGEESSVALGYLPRGSGEPLFALDPLTGAKRALSITATFGT
jgi:folate-binding protein YgfZ